MSAETQAERTRAVTEQTLAAHRAQATFAGITRCSCGADVPDHDAHQADEVARALATERAQTTDTLTKRLTYDDRRALSGFIAAQHKPGLVAAVEGILAAHQAGDRDAHQALAGDDIRALSDLIDSTYPANLSAEAHLWRRCAKVTEENGEVTEALLGTLGENPRKGQTHSLLHVRAELLDVALAALGAVAHLEPHADPLHAVSEHAGNILARLRRALGVADDQHDGSGT